MNTGQKTAKKAFFVYLEQVGFHFRHVRNVISTQIIHEFVAREKLYRMA